MSFLRAVLASSALLVVGTSCTGEGARGGSNAGDPSVPEGSTSVSFDTSQALSLGSGCPDKNLDVDVTATTTGLHLSFRQLRLDLAAGDTQLSGLLACSVRVPFHAPSGHRVASVLGRLVYGVDKSAGASGMASSAVILSATPTPLVSIEVPRGAAMSIPALTY